MKTIIGVLILVALVIGGFFIIKNETGNQVIAPTTTAGDTGSAPTTSTDTTGGTSTDTTSGTGIDTTTSGGDTVTSYSMTNVATHKDGTSCWTVINGGVYDVTSWINQHPGGPDAILSLCGKDGSSTFTNQHEGQMRPEQELAGFKIGVLK